MKLFSIESGELGQVAAVRFTGGHRASTVQDLETYLRSQDGEFFHGEGVHRLYVALKSAGVKARKLSSLRTGQVVKIKVGKATLVDIAAWDLGLEVDGDEGRLEWIKVDERVPSSPTLVVINDYRSAVYKSGAYSFAQTSKLSFMEAMLSSSRIPTQGFKPAYGGGLMSSPADSAKIYENVISYDISSSYPWTAATTLMPSGSTRSIPLDMLSKLRVVDGSVYLGKGVGFIGLFRFKGLKRNNWVRIPLIRSRDEEYCQGGVFDDNGMVSCDEMAIALCPDSLKSLSLQYTWDSVSIEILEAHKLRRLPEGITNFLGDAYRRKEGERGAARLRAKVAINTAIGLWGTCPFKKAEHLEYSNGIFISRYDRDLSKAWATYAGADGDGIVAGGKRCWDFRWAVYAIAAAQRRIVETEMALYEAGLEVLYCDTDSIKMAGDKAIADGIFADLNRMAEAANREIGLPKGMGVWVDESRGYHKVVFRAKKFYATEDELGNREAYIAGLYKDDANAMVQATTLQRIAEMDEIVIYSSRPDFGTIENDPFGATEQQMPREMVFRYTRGKLFVTGGDNVAV